MMRESVPRSVATRSDRFGPRAAPLLLLATLAACGAIPPEETGLRVARALDLARVRVEAGDAEQAEQLLRAVGAVDPDDPALLALRSAVPPDPVAESVYHTPWLGSNRARRLPTRRPGWARALLYLPDRVLDLLDCVSLDLHFGPGAFIDLHVTRAVQLGAGGRFVGGLGWHDHRSLGAQFQGESALNLPLVGTSAYLAGKVGTSGLALTRQAVFDAHRPTDPLYQEWRDYWAVGFAVTFVLSGIDFDVHPVEAADFLVGFSTVDFLRDDFAATTSVDLRGAEEAAVRGLVEVAGSRRAVAAYREWAAALR